jgi:hypothetical protein
MLEHVKSEPLTISDSKPYHVDLDSIPKPSPIIRTYGKFKSDGTIEVIPRSRINESEVVILTHDEYSKVAQLVELASTYKDIVIQQTNLINEKITIENSLKEFIRLEHSKSNLMYNMYVHSENMYRQASYDRKVDNIIAKTVQIILTGCIVGLAF